MKLNSLRLTVPVLFAIGLTLSACNPLSNDNINSPDDNAPGVDKKVYTGSASKGPLTGATISVYAIDNTGQKTGAALTQTTSIDGTWSVAINNDNHNILLVESAGGTYVDESDPETDINKKRKVTLNADEVMHGILIPSENTAAINFLTHSLVKMFQNETGNAADVVQALNRIRSRAYNAFDFDPFTELPTDPISPATDASDIEKTYALLIGGGAYALNSVSMLLDKPDISYQAIELMTSDFSDCKIDGFIHEQIPENLTTDTQTSLAKINLKDEILRFRNNHYEKYKNASLPRIDDIEFCNTQPAISLALPSELIGLSLSAGTLTPSFDTATHTYTVSVPWAVSSIEISPQADTAGTTIEIGTQSVVSGNNSNPIPLTIGSNVITLQVVTESGILQDNYVLTINRNDQPIVTSANSYTIVENNVDISTVVATDSELDALSFSIDSGTDSGFFTINAATGELKFIAAPDYEIPLDANADNIYQVVVGVSDGENIVSHSIDVTVTDINDVTPAFLTTSYSTKENSASNVATMSVVDADSSSFNYTLAGGGAADQSLFTINTTTGQLSMTMTPDFESPGDFDSDGIYEVDVTVSDGTFSTTSTINVIIEDQIEINTVADAGIKTLSLNWNTFAGADTYRVFFEHKSGAGFTQIGSDTASTNFDATLASHLTDWNAAGFIVEAYKDAGATLLSTSPIQYVNSSHMLGAVGYFKASNTASSTQFGQDVAVSADGNTMAVGSPYESTSNAGSGAVYVFIRSGNTWVQQGTPLKAVINGVNHYFGISVDISSNGDLLVIGANNEASGEGAAYVFQRSGGVWSEQQKLKASVPVAGDTFGSDVAISADGNTIAVSEPADATDGTYSGSVHIFTFSGSWTLQDELRPNNGATNFAFGTSIAISNNGDTLVVGAPGETSTTQSINSTPNTSGFQVGAAYVFKRVASAWSQHSYLKAFNAEDSDNYGFAVAVSDDAFTIAVGATGEDSSTTGIDTTPTDSNNTDDYGAVYTYEWNGSAWIDQAYIKAIHSDVDDNFGASVALNNDGSVLAVGADFEDGASQGINGVNNNGTSQTGAVFVYQLESNVWNSVSYVKAKNLSFDDRFGSSISLDGSGKTLAVGAFKEDSSTTDVDSLTNDSYTDSGAVYIY